MVAIGSRSASSGVQQQRQLHNQHAIPPRASERATRRDRARAQRPAADQPAPFDPAFLGTAVHPDACMPAVHSAHGAASWLREDELASRAVQVPLAKANPPVLDARSLARRTELRRACSARGIDYSICDELHELEDRLAADAGGESAQQCASAAEELGQRLLVEDRWPSTERLPPALASALHRPSPPALEPALDCAPPPAPPHPAHSSPSLGGSPRAAATGVRTNATLSTRMVLSTQTVTITARSTIRSAVSTSLPASSSWCPAAQASTGARATSPSRVLFSTNCSTPLATWEQARSEPCRRQRWHRSRRESRRL